jgi:GNAT superfamily N-acetyltransferase
MTASSSQPATVRAASTTGITLEELAWDSPPETLSTAQELLLEYGQFVAAQPRVGSFCYGDLQNEVSGLPGSYLNQQGGALVARTTQSETPLNWVGFVAWRTLPVPELAAAWELKRLWIRPAGRGLGLGRVLAQAVIDRAKSAGKSLLLLDTAPHAMSAAYRLYLDMGFLLCPAYNGPPAEGIVYMCKHL